MPAGKSQSSHLRVKSTFFTPNVWLGSGVYFASFTFMFAVYGYYIRKLAFICSRKIACNRDTLDSWIPRYLDTWIPGYLDTWIHGYMDTWLHGYLDVDTFCCFLMYIWLIGSIWVHIVHCTVYVNPKISNPQNLNTRDRNFWIRSN